MTRWAEYEEEVQRGKIVIGERLGDDYDYELQVTVRVGVARGALQDSADIYRELFSPDTSAVMVARLGFDALMRTLSSSLCDPTEELLKMTKATRRGRSSYGVLSKATIWADRFPGAEVSLRWSGTRIRRRR